MELFQKAISVKLSHNDKYLVAEDDQESVCQDRDGSSKINSIWVVELADGGDFLRFKSCHGKYLTASNVPFLPGSSGRKVLQTIPKKHDCSSIEWEPIRDGFSVRFKTRCGHFLRPNGGLPPWRNSVTHDIPHRMGTQEKVLWDIEIVESLGKTNSPLPSLSPKPHPTTLAFPTQREPPILALPPLKFKVKHWFVAFPHSSS
ncbi:unnamed protein product [Camellia sinensis]|uniref:DUF569 domain-containing protein n=1 Tax=Camellia sinensis var. sinensis TaxID=542762 RepID=A0A4S4DMQ4_CAMSN|nr:uncharacterized protein LOC114292797 [Camellia sinensis]XP_028099054.1 uncharacterized protein LOC114298643 [Camellia sinensis]THG03416.1 hypothetical protein TEA_026323 [Camellia sinensis var. sinensis]